MCKNHRYKTKGTKGKREQKPRKHLPANIILSAGKHPAIRNYNRSMKVIILLKPQST